MREEERGGRESVSIRKGCRELEKTIGDREKKILCLSFDDF